MSGKANSAMPHRQRGVQTPASGRHPGRGLALGLACVPWLALLGWMTVGTIGTLLWWMQQTVTILTCSVSSTSALGSGGL